MISRVRSKGEREKMEFKAAVGCLSWASLFCQLFLGMNKIINFVYIHYTTSAVIPPSH